MTSFKKGDKVQCIDNIHFREMIVGFEYEVSRTDNDGYCLYFVGDDYRGYNKRYFKLIQPMAHPFKVGDKVAPAPGESYVMFKPEMVIPEMVITEVWININDKVEYVKVSDLSDNHIGTFYAHRFQLIQPMAQEIKAGDTVRCKNAQGRLEQGKEYTASKVFDNMIELKELEGGAYMRHRFEKVETRKLVGYKLKKDLPDLKAGAVYTKTNELLTYPWSCSVPGGRASIYSQEDIEKTDWFEPVYEKPNQEFVLAGGKRLWVDFQKKEIRILNGVPHEALAFSEVGRIVGVMQSGISSNKWACAITQIKYGCVFITLDEAVNLSILIS